MWRNGTQESCVYKKRLDAGTEGDVPALSETPADKCIGGAVTQSRNASEGSSAEEIAGKVEESEQKEKNCCEKDQNESTETGEENCCEEDQIHCECKTDESNTAEKTENGGKVRCCAVCGSTEKLQRCSHCKSTLYCSKKCQKDHHPHHSKFCPWVVDLQKLETEKVYRGFSVRQETLDFKTKKKIVKLVGEKPLLRCFLGGKRFKTLWDTGSQVCLADMDWMEEYFPNVVIQPVEEYMEEMDEDGKNLEIRAANKTQIPLEGVAVVEFSLTEGGESFFIPIVVSKNKVAEPILGYNVIANLLKEGSAEQRKLLQSALECETNNFSVDALAAIVEEKSENPSFITEVSSSQSFKVPSNRKIQIKCRVKAQSNGKEQTVYFEPLLSPDDDQLVYCETVSTLRKGHTNYVVVEVLNRSSVDKWVKKGEVIGSVHTVSAVIPMTKMFNMGKTETVSKKANVGAVGCVDEEGSETEETEGEAVKWDLSHLDTEKREKLEAVLKRCDGIFSKGATDIGDIKEFKMPINIVDQVPVTASYQKIPPHLYTQVKEYIEDMRTNGWIRESYSAYSSPIVCARNKNGTMRLCIDYRKLNAKTIPDAQPIPRMQDILDTLGGSKWFSTLDMSKAYHQGYIEEKFRHLTAFVTPWTLYEWNRIPFGLRNAPPAFQRYINRVLGEFKGILCEPYLDDVLCYSKEFDKHVEDLEKVLVKMQEKGIKLRAEKCHFAKQEVRYLGRLISSDGYRPDPADTDALEKFRTAPRNIGELRSLLGFIGYYRSYVRDFSRRVKPLYELLKGKVTKPKGKSGTKSSQRYDSREKIEWGELHQKVLEEMIDYLKSPEVIAFANFEHPFFMNCDASNEGLGAVLYQTQEGVDRVISYASRTMSDAEKNYHMHSGKLEFLALKWAITDRFSDYLCHAQTPFKVYTDNNPLTYVLSTAKLNAVGMRWVSELADYNFSLHYKPGVTNTDADYLSRRPAEIEDLKKQCTESMDPKTVAVIVSGVGDNVQAVSGALSAEKLVWKPDSEVVSVSMTELKEKQVRDAVVGPVYKSVLSGSRPAKKDWDGWSHDSKILLRNFEKLYILNGVLFRKTAKFNQIVLPSQYHQIVFDELHVKMGHLGVEKVVDLAQARFYWPNMAHHIKQFVQKRCRCIINKQPNVKEKAPLHPISAKSPFEMISIDFIELDTCSGGYKYGLVACDHFTRFVQFYATRSKSSKAAADKIFNDFILQYGFPKRIHHDRGPEWNSNLWKELHRLSGIKASNTTPYNPQGDGQVERYNRTLLNMLRTLSQKEKKNWRKHLPKLAFAVNSTVSKATHYSPFFLLYGREPKLPIDGVFQEAQEYHELKRKSHDQFVKEWESSMKEAHEIARENIEKLASYNKRYHDDKAKAVEIKVGDLVLVQNMREREGKAKMRSYWEESLFKVTDVKENVPVYTITNVRKSKDVRVVHRNKLMRVNELPLNVFGEIEETRKKQGNVRKKEKKELIQENNIIQEDSDDADDMVLVLERQFLPEEASNGLEQVMEESEETMGDVEEDTVLEINEELIVDVPEDDQFSDVDEEIPPLSDTDSADATFPYDEVGDPDSVEEIEAEDSDSSAENIPIRRSARGRVPKMISSHSELGGEMVMIPVGR